MNIELQKVVDIDKDEFMKMARAHFHELSASFIPAPDWEKCYFENIQKNLDFSLDWIVSEGDRCGFALYGIEPHRFLPRRTGMVYELYVAPEFRRRGIAAACAAEVLQRLRKLRPSKIQLEVVEGNEAAAVLWKKFGFKKVSERLILQ